MARLRWSLEFFHDVERFRRSSLQSSLCRYIFFGGESSKAKIVKRLKAMKLADPMVALELALWKAACELRPPHDKLSPLQWKEWSHNGWKGLKATMRRDPLTCITFLVAPFLGLKAKGRTRERELKVRERELNGRERERERKVDEYHSARRSRFVTSDLSASKVAVSDRSSKDALVYSRRRIL